ncbi:MAG: anthrone oxygenase family protein [Bacteroidota bacterium]
MLFTIKSLTLYLAILLTGLSAGLFFAWAVSIIPGTQRISDAGYLESMQSINRAILNPAFYLVFMGPIISLGLSTLQHYSSGPPFWLLLVATVLYLLGTFGITVFGNVPLNDQLELLELSQLTAEQSKTFRLSYEQDWNRFHALRTLASVAAFGIALVAAFGQ